MDYIYKLVLNQIYGYLTNKLKGMTIDHDFGYFFLSPLKKRRKKKSRMN